MFLNRNFFSLTALAVLSLPVSQALAAPGSMKSAITTSDVTIVISDPDGISEYWVYDIDLNTGQYTLSTDVNGKDAHGTFSCDPVEETRHEIELDRTNTPANGKRQHVQFVDCTDDDDAFLSNHSGGTFVPGTPTNHWEEIDDDDDDSMSVNVVDMNKDGLPDVITVFRSEGRVSLGLFVNNGMTFDEPSADLGTLVSVQPEDDRMTLLDRQVIFNPAPEPNRNNGGLSIAPVDNATVVNQVGELLLPTGTPTMTTTGQCWKMGGLRPRFLKNKSTKAECKKMGGNSWCELGGSCVDI